MTRTITALLDQKDALFLISCLEQDGYSARFVGGCVRDSLLGRTLGDIDLASSATPPQMLGCLERHAIKIVPTGIDHGTVTAVVNGKGYEITTLRKDVKTDGRHAEVVFTTDWEQDAHRRDFTVNALSVDCHGAIFDYCGGMADMAARHLRFIDDATQRMREDYLRLLRLFRFSSVLKWPITDKDLLAQCRSLAPFLKNLSRERIQAELVKLVMGGDAVPVLEQMEEYDILQAFVPQIYPDAAAGIIAREQEFSRPDAFRRLVALFGKTRADALDPMMVLSREQKKRIQAMDDFYHYPVADARHVIVNKGRQTAEDCFFLFAPATWDGDRVLTWEPPLFPLKAADLEGISGPALGYALKQAQQWWMEQNFAPAKEAVKTIALTAAKEFQK